MAVLSIVCASGCVCVMLLFGVSQDCDGMTSTSSLASTKGFSSSSSASNSSPSGALSSMAVAVHLICTILSFCEKRCIATECGVPDRVAACPQMILTSTARMQQRENRGLRSSRAKPWVGGELCKKPVSWWHYSSPKRK